MGITCTGGRTPVLKLFSFNIYFSKKEVRMRFLGWVSNEHIIYAEMIGINMRGG